MKKVRVQSRIEQLPLHVKQQLAAWLTTGGRHGHGITYAQARAKLVQEHGFRCGTNALSRFFRRHNRFAEPRILAGASNINPVERVTLVINLRRDSTTPSGWAVHARQHVKNYLFKR
jgi:hypothetical protein